MQSSNNPIPNTGPPSTHHVVVDREPKRTRTGSRHKPLISEASNVFGDRCVCSPPLADTGFEESLAGRHSGGTNRT